MTLRQQLSGEYVVGQFRTHDGMIVVQAATPSRELTYCADNFKKFNSRQAAARWRDYVPEDFSNVRDMAVLPLPVPQDD